LAEAEPRPRHGGEAGQHSRRGAYSTFPLEAECIFQDTSSPPRCTPPELKAVAAAAHEANIPAKSKEKYEKALKDFLAWCDEKKVPDGYYSPNILVSYFEDLKKTYAPSTLWATYSKLKKTLLARKKVNIDDKPFKILKERISAFGVDYEPKKSRVFTLDEVYDFCRRADDETYLAMKVMALIGMTGALRHSELYELAPTDIVDRGEELLVNIRHTKVHRRKQFIVLKHSDPAIDPVATYRRYLALRPDQSRMNKARNPPHSAVFLRYGKGTCSAARIGKKTIAKVPCAIATFLKLDSPAEYTGHAFRRTGATSMVNNGGDLLDVVALGDWKSNSVAQGYIAESDPLRRKRAALVQGLPPVKELRVDVTGATVAGTQPIFNITGCTNVTVNLVAPGATNPKL
jgi:integrase